MRPVERRTVVTPPGADHRRREEQGAEHRDDDQARGGPVRDLRRRDHVERRAAAPGRGRRAGARRRCRRAGRSCRCRAGKVAAQHRDARELPDPAGQDRVREQTDRRRPEKTRLKRGCGGSSAWSIVSRHASERSSTEPRLRHERESDPGPVDEIERVVDDVPVGAAPPEQDDDGGEEGDDERSPQPRAARDPSHAATARLDAAGRVVDAGRAGGRCRPRSSARSRAAAPRRRAPHGAARPRAGPRSPRRAPPRSRAARRPRSRRSSRRGSR